MSDIVKVNFHGQEIDCVRNEEGVWVSLRRICDNIGIDADSQRAKLETKGWASTVLITVQLPDDGQRRQLFMIHLRSLPMWLATIDAERVAEHVRPKIELYQREAADVLAAHFLKSKRRAVPDEVRALTAKRLEAKERRLNAEFLLRTLRTINRVTPLHPDVFAATAATAAETVIGRELPALKPKTIEEWFSPTQIAEQLGVSVQRVGLLITELGIRGNFDGLSRAVLNKASHSDKTITTYQYSPRAVQMIADKLAEKPELAEAKPS